MTSEEQANLATVRMYLAALQSGEAGESLSRFFAEDVWLVELPNKLNPAGRECDLPAMLKRSEEGQTVLREQRYEIVSEIARGSRVAVEARWFGVLAIPMATLPAGAEMKAHFAMFLELSDGKITLQRNYDCFEPF